MLMFLNKMMMMMMTTMFNFKLLALNSYTT